MWRLRLRRRAGGSEGGEGEVVVLVVLLRSRKGVGQKPCTGQCVETEEREERLEIEEMGEKRSGRRGKDWWNMMSGCLFIL